ncbi:hypothetical protein [Aeromonas veronii]|uniref:hypothetical protein n=1 Tax=Aeromonas veronii TaxID=654 RepID=UPI003D1A956B
MQLPEFDGSISPITHFALDAIFSKYNAVFNPLKAQSITLASLYILQHNQNPVIKCAIYFARVRLCIPSQQAPIKIINFVAMLAINFHYLNPSAIRITLSTIPLPPFIVQRATFRCRWQ